ncbi:hypothetical protein Lalb_Chr12g0207591 [Lupinus albus]|uniref:Uncharacterized protein n=1 Tax=Lupinus albus TaxID=3870 RepID=A0A6A4PP05_LUPAL|nr:hypothetical protein Lalb_Chr12g0207591 [Lupinus albus]
MFSVFFPTFRVYQDVVDENYHKRVQIGMENPIHILHKDCRSISYTERHHQILIVPVSRPESSLRNILRPYSQLMVTRPEVDL